ncbi:hypothetical protein ACWOFR_18405 [Carnobacterium gallinarum]|uniref:hypothetical protein n=1 Tax=Carnobacterium gallinarum TaxID=2749 RepID=UPI000550E51C|nr:hypothetical protein [Carnobacterium gallinarum]
MSDVRIKGGALADAIATSNELKEALHQSLKTIHTLEGISSGSNRTWTGESKSIYLMYLNILLKSHQKLEEIVKVQDKALRALKKDSASMDKGATMATIRSI